MEVKDRVMNEKNWQFLSASSTAILPSRLSVFWNYIIRGRIPKYSIEAWVNTEQKGIANIKLFVHYKGKVNNE